MNKSWVRLLRLLRRRKVVNEAAKQGHPWPGLTDEEVGEILKKDFSDLYPIYERYSTGRR